MFDDLLEANRRYRTEHHDSRIEGVAAKGLAVLTCIDSRIDPLALLGLRTGDAKIIRNAGGRVTDDCIRSLVLATLLGVTRICLVQHTDCAVARSTDEEIRGRISAMRGVDAAGWTFLAGADQRASLQADLERIGSCPLLPSDVRLGAFIFDVHSGELIPVTRLGEPPTA